MEAAGEEAEHALNAALGDGQNDPYSPTPQR
jgi:hypothetical protein